MTSYPQDLETVQLCLNGSEQGWVRLQELYRPHLYALLVNRGASTVEAEDLLAEFWMDLGGYGKSNEPLLARFSGAGPLRCWLTTVLYNRFIGTKRRKRRAMEFHNSAAQEDFFNEIPSPDVSRESDLAVAVRGCLMNAWGKCPAESRVMLQLVYLESITQREIAALWGWHESKVSRSLDSAMQGIRRETLREFAAFDPASSLGWEDLLALGNQYESLFASSPTHPSEAFRSTSCGIAA